MKGNNKRKNRGNVLQSSIFKNSVFKSSISKRSASQGSILKSTVLKKRFIIFAIAILLIASVVMAVTGGSGLKNLAKNLFNAGESANFGENENDDGLSVISMETTGFSSSEPGSWHLDKYAKWTDIDKARITFDVTSNQKVIEGRNKDVIFVIDISGSMSGAKLERVKTDSIGLVDYLLSDDLVKTGV